jgi:PAS domain S-box-containing protein
LQRLFRKTWFHYFAALAAVGVALALRALLDPWLGSGTSTVLLYGALAIAVWLGGFRPALLAAVVGYLVAHYLFVEPRGAFALNDPNDVTKAIAYVISATLIIALGGRMHAARERLELNEHELGKRVAELEARNQQIQAFMRNAPAGVVVKDAAGRHTYANGAVEQLLGWSPGSWRGRKNDELFPPELAARVDALDRRTLTEDAAVHSDETVNGRDLHTIRFPLRDARNRVFIALIAVDISEQKRGEEALRAAQEQLQLIADTMSVGVVFCRADLTFVWANRVYAQWMQRSMQEVVGRTLGEVIGERSLLEIRPYIDRVLGGESVHYERQADYPGLGRRWIGVLLAPTLDAKGRPVGLVSVISDIEERKRVEEAFRDARQQLQIILDTIPSAVLQCDRDARCRWVNPTYERWTGRPAQELVGMPLSEILGEAAMAELQPHIDRVLAGEHVHYERLVDLPGFSRRWVSAVLSPTYSPERSPDGWVIVSTDIHERKVMEEALKEADRRKDEFLATLAHELRNPLAPIRNAASILRKKGPLAPEIAWSTDVIERQVDQMSRLVDDLIDIGRITGGTLVMRKQRMPLERAIDMALETSRPNVNQAGHFLSVLMPGESAIVEADPVRLAQVFSNLLNNAAKYTEPGGSLCLSASIEGDEVVVSVEDSGVGLPPEVAEALFRPFSGFARLEERGQGMLGVGLTLVRGIVKLHGGKVEARSAGPGKGTEFIVRLPLAAGESIAGEPLAPPVRTPATKLRILVADDNADAADSLQRLLGIEGNDVRVAYDGIAALKAVGEFMPQLAVIDIAMPGLNGYEVARAIRDERGKEVVLVALTGWGQEGDRRRAMEAGFDYHLTKPVDAAALMDLLAEVSARRSPVAA